MHHNARVQLFLIKATAPMIRILTQLVIRYDYGSVIKRTLQIIEYSELSQSITLATVQSMD